MTVGTNCVPSGCPCYGIREGQLEFEVHGTLDSKASSWASPSKRATTNSHHVFSLVPDNPLETFRCWFRSIPNNHSAAKLKGRGASNVHLWSKSTSHQVIQGPHRKRKNICHYIQMNVAQEACFQVFPISWPWACKQSTLFTSFLFGVISAEFLMPLLFKGLCQLF